MDRVHQLGSGTSLHSLDTERQEILNFKSYIDKEMSAMEQIIEAARLLPGPMEKRVKLCFCTSYAREVVMLIKEENDDPRLEDLYERDNLPEAEEIAQEMYSAICSIEYNTDVTPIIPFLTDGCKEIRELLHIQQANIATPPWCLSC